MSYGELSAHVADIVLKAKEWELERKGYLPAGDGTYYPPPGYSNADANPHDPSTSQDYVDRDMAELDTKYDHIPDLFDPYLSMPDPASYDGAIARISAAQGRLSAGSSSTDPATGMDYPANPTLDGMDTSADWLARWTGRAAMSFKENFVDTFESITQNQFLALGYVRGALEAEKSIWHAARQNIDKIAEDTLTALDHMDDCGKNEWGMAFTVAGAVVALVAVPFTAGGSLVAAYTFAGIGGALSVGGAAVGNTEDTPELPMSGESPEAVTAAMSEAITMLGEEITKAEQKVRDNMTELDSLLTAHPELFVAPRPDLADATPNSIDGDMGRSR